MNAREFIDKVGAEEAERVAKAAGTNLDYLRQIANGHRNASVKLAEKLVEVQSDLDFMSLIKAKKLKEAS